MTTTRDLITGALRLVNVVQANETPSPDDMDVCAQALNGMIDSWSAERLAVYNISPYYFQTQPGQKDYLLGPDGDWKLERPMRINSMYVSRGATVIKGAEPSKCSQLFNFNEGPTDIGLMVSGDGSVKTYDTVTGLGSPLNVDQDSDNLGIDPLLDSHSEFGASALKVRISDGSPIQLSTSPVTSKDWTIEWSFAWPSPGANPGDPYSGAHNYQLHVFELNFDFDPTRKNTFYAIAHANDGPGYLMEVSSNPYAYGGWSTGAIWNMGNTGYDRWAATMDSSNKTVTLYLNGQQVAQVVANGDQWDQPDITWDTPWAWTSINVKGYNNYSGESPYWLDSFRITPDANYVYQDSEFTYIPPGTPTVDTYVLTPTTIDYPMEKLNDSQYASLRLKTLASTFPTKFYDNGDWPARKISVWPVPMESDVVTLWLWEPLINLEDLDAEVAFPKGYERALRFNLACEVAPEFGKEIPDAVSRIAAESKSKIKRVNSGAQIMRGDMILNSAGADSYTIGFTIPD